jgi:hypothetical protein
MSPLTNQNFNASVLLYHVRYVQNVRSLLGRTLGHSCVIRSCYVMFVYLNSIREYFTELTYDNKFDPVGLNDTGRSL